jgi:hypothetical protein
MSANDSNATKEKEISYTIIIEVKNLFVMIPLCGNWYRL